MNNNYAWQQSKTEQVCFQFPTKNRNTLDCSQFGWEAVL